MDSKTPLRLKLKFGGSSTPEQLSPNQVKMTDEEHEQMASDEDMDDDEWQDGGLCEEPDEGDRGKPSFISQEDSSKERHKKSKKKKKKKEKERERHKHRHHRERNDGDDDEPSSKRRRSEDVDSEASLAAFKSLLIILLKELRKKDVQNFFAAAVTDLMAPGYSSIISEPMNFARMGEKIQEGGYVNLNQFMYDLRLICNNCMMYNQPDTVYHKVAKKLLQSGERVLSQDRVQYILKELPVSLHITSEQLGFDIENCDTASTGQEAEDGSEGSFKTDTENSMDRQSQFEGGQDELSSDDILNQCQNAAKEAHEKLTLKKPSSTLGFLRQRRDGTTTLNFLTGCEGSDPNQKEKPVSLGLITGKLTQGLSSLHNYKDDKRSMAKPVKALNYGSFSSFCPSYDSTFANLTKEESDMVHSTYGNETAVQYAESICDFSRDCDMAMHLVDQLLNLLTHQQHSRTKTTIEDRKKQDEQRLASLYPVQDESSTSVKKESGPNFSSLRSLSDLGIETNFLENFEKLEEREKVIGAKLSENAALLETLEREQRERLSKPLPANLSNISQISQSELQLASKITEGLVSVASQIPPGALAPVPIVRRAMGITMMPVNQDGEHMEVDIEETSSLDSSPPKQSSSHDYGSSKLKDVNTKSLLQQASK